MSTVWTSGAATFRLIRRKTSCTASAGAVIVTARGHVTPAWPCCLPGGDPMRMSYRRAARLITGAAAVLVTVAGLAPASAGTVVGSSEPRLPGAVTYVAADGVFTVDLADVDPLLDVVYGTVPSPWGELSFVLSNVPRPDPGCPRCFPQDDPSGGDTSDCPDNNT